jgi:hypothetical protein
MKDYQQTQLAFIDHLKNPDAHAFDYGIEDRRLQIYRELFFNNILGFLSSGFPVLESLYSEQDWHTLARNFFAEHECRSPYFTDISKEFVEYLSSSYQLKASDPPFLLELAHYEWIELAVSVRKQTEAISYWDGSAKFDSVMFSELASLVSYQFPVHQISVDFQPQESDEIVYLVVYRNAEDEVNFTLLNTVSAHMLNIIQSSEAVDVEELAEAMVEAMPQLDPKQVEEGTRQTLKNMLSQQILLPD